jgi:hypothetical protein
MLIETVVLIVIAAVIFFCCRLQVEKEASVG